MNHSLVVCNRLKRHNAVHRLSIEREPGARVRRVRGICDNVRSHISNFELFRGAGRANRIRQIIHIVDDNSIGRNAQRRRDILFKLSCAEDASLSTTQIVR
jgi:hypothetical protein